MENIKNFNDLLFAKYGKKGTPKREEFHAKAKAFYICEMLKEERKKAKRIKILQKYTTSSKKYLHLLVEY
jgi:hypothetical protein